MRGQCQQTTSLQLEECGVGTRSQVQSDTLPKSSIKTTQAFLKLSTQVFKAASEAAKSLLDTAQTNKWPSGPSSVAAWLPFSFKLAGYKLSHLIWWRNDPCAQSHHNIRYNWQAQIRACNFCDLTAVRYARLQLYLSQYHKKDRWDI